MKRAWSVAVAVVGAAALAYAAIHFPWREAGHSLARANSGWLVAAAIVNLISLVAKGASWHLLIRRAGPLRLGSSIGATILGAAAGSVGPSVTGEAVRLKFLVAREPIPLRTATAGVVAARMLEAISLIALVAGGSALLPDAAWTRTLRAAAIALLCIAAVGSRPAIMRRVAPKLASAMGERATRGALGLAALSWIAQWAAYYAACRAVALPEALGLSLAALILSNLGGLLRLTPGNVGVLQAAFAIAALRMALPAAPAVAASFLLQGVQILPVLLAGGLVLTIHSMRPERALRAPAVAA